MNRSATLVSVSAMMAAMPALAYAQDVNSFGKSDFYVGVLGGFGAGTSTVNPPSAGFNQSLNPAAIGVVTGYRVNSNDWLFGVEGDINANLSNSFASAGIGSFAEDDGSGHLRVLLGRQMGPISLFAAGGLAGTHVKYNTVGGPGVDDRIMLGWTAGIGAEYAATENISLRIEALHDETSTTFSDGYNGKWVDNTVRVGAIVKF